MSRANAGGRRPAAPRLSRVAARRARWLEEIRRRKTRRFDTEFAPTYDRDWGAITPRHASFVRDLVGRIPPGSVVLDAACGTGKYWPLVRSMGRRVFGVDASRGMLAVARAKHPEVETRMADLTTLALPESYPAVMCVDALENLPPERWPGALRRLARATRPAGWLYVTVERTTPEEAEAAYRSGRARGEPLVRGEDTRAGYHYYPSEERVRDWMRRAGLVVVREERDAPTHGEYWHLLCRPAKTRRRAVAARTRPRREERRPLR